MLSEASHSSIAAKIKVMYGRRITPAIYGDLLKKRTVAEISALLKETESYANVLAGVDPNLLHRDQLEGMLRKELYNEHLKLIKFSQRDDKTLLKLILKKYEIDQILSFLRFLKSDRANEFIYSIPQYIIEESEIKFEKLSGCNSYDDFLETIKPTHYYKQLKNCDFEKPEIMSVLESVLSTGYYASFFQIIKKYGKEVGKDIMRTVGSKIDISNIIHIIRLKKYYNTSSFDILIQLIPYNHRITKTVLKAMAEAKTVEDIYEMIDKTVYAKLFSENKFPFIEEYLYKAVYEISYKFLIFGAPSVVIPVAYLNLKETEIKNLITIIEGKRYQLEADEIRGHLIGI